MQAPLNTVADLDTLLASHGIDTSKYGRDSAKSLSQLLKEIQEGECFFDVVDGVLIRYVNVLNVAIKRNDGAVLYEESQTFHRTETREEYTRKRENMLLAEKMLPGEDAIDATIRALDEELDIHISSELELAALEVRVVDRRIEKKFSPSYPELLCSYSKVKTEVTAETLPVVIPDGYTFTEYFPNGEPRVTATWEWR